MRRLFWVALLIGLATAFVLSVSLGSVRIPISGALAVLFGSEVERETWRTIIWQFRLPKAMTATLAGASLAIAGLQMQTLFRNPLADPFVLGVSSGASLGVALVVLAGTAVGASLFGGLGLFANLGVVTAASMGSDGTFVAGLPEELALNGAITRSFQNDGVAFDVNSGAFRLCLPQDKTACVVDEDGAGADLFWTQRLLERAGFNISPNNTGCVVQVEVVRRGLWRVQGIEAGSLAQVLALAQKYGLTA